MKYIVITLPYFWEGEAEAITRMFEAGLERMHIRKPGSTAEQRETLLRAIPERYYPHIVIGDKLMGRMANGQEGDKAIGHACHSIDELRTWQEKLRDPQFRIDNPQFQYLSLSPIFDSISKVGYKAAFSHEELMAAKEEGIIDEHVMALGGICQTNTAEALSYGFGGVMVLGDAWKGDGIK